MNVYTNIKKEGRKIIMKTQEKKVAAKALTVIVNYVLSVAANSRCMVFFHQPKQPDEVKKFRRF